MEKSYNNFLPLLVAAAFISISLYEILSALFLLSFFYVSIRERRKPRGMLLTPLILYSVPTFASTAIYNPTHLVRAAGQAIFPLLYVGKDHVAAGERFFLAINRLLALTGVLLIPVIAYRFLMLKEIAPLWGGPFEIGLFYTFFALSALSLFFFSRKKRYLLLFIVFAILIFFSTKRAPVIGFFFALILLSFINRRSIDRKIFFFVAASLLVISVAAFSILVHEDVRFHTFYNVVIGRERVNDATLDRITSIRWTLFQRGVQVISNDLREGRVINLLIGHGLRPGQNLEPKAPPGYTSYESIFVISEFIERGMVGLLGILVLCVRYFVFVGRFAVSQKEDYLRLPFLLQPAALLTGMIFTGFWDALLPLYLLLFGLVENEKKAEKQFPA
jgi:hypothetical protein